MNVFLYVTGEEKAYDLTGTRTQDHFQTVSGEGLSPVLATCEISQDLLVGVSGGFPGVLPFRSTYRLARLDMSEIILKGMLN